MPTVTIHTTQNVSIDYQTANVGARIGAFLIDVFLVGLFYTLVVFLLALLDIRFLSEELIVTIPLFLILLYFFFVEMLSRGQTLGKRLLRLRVIRLDGRDPTPGDFLARSVFLLPDVVFTLGLQAILLISTSRYQQRLGDLVARTVVIATDQQGNVTLEGILRQHQRAGYDARFPAVQRLTDEDMIVVKETLLREKRYRNAAHRTAVSELANRMVEVLELDKSEIPDSPQDFLELLLRDYIVLTR